MAYVSEVYARSLTKADEELCGDQTEVFRDGDSTIVVLADGLGSGVKANILATMTAKISGTMVRRGASLKETMETLASTLPECSVRKMAYSTFTLARIRDNGQVYVVEFDNPKFILVRRGEIREIPKARMEIQGKILYESRFTMDPEDFLVFISDGVVYAGTGPTMNLNWTWDDVAGFLSSLSRKDHTVRAMVLQLMGVVGALYSGKPGDDSTALGIKLHEKQDLSLFIGPPADPQDDALLFQEIEKRRREKHRIIIAGGTTANIYARESQRILEKEGQTEAGVPPTSALPGIDLVTEGVLTVHEVIELLKRLLAENPDEGVLKDLAKSDASATMARMIVEECTSLNIVLGMAVNPDHQVPDFPLNFEVKVRQIDELRILTQQLGKSVKVSYM